MICTSEITKVIVPVLVLLGIGAIITAEKRRKKTGNLKGPQKKPKYIVIVSRYPKGIPEEQLRSLEKKYGVEKIEVYNASRDFQEQHRKITVKLEEKENHKENGNQGIGIPGYQSIMQFIEQQKDEIPQLLILCADTTALKISKPLLIYAAEVVHYRRNFSEEILCRALDHYSNCEKRDGK